MDFKQCAAITMVSNPVRYASRYRLAEVFKKHIAASGVPLYICEVQHGDREFAVTSDTDPHHLQLRTTSVLWHKENALNLVLAKLPPEVKYVAILDADIAFQHYHPGDDQSWVREMWHQLQMHEVVQLWQNAIDMGPSGEALAIHRGFVSQYRNNNQTVKKYAAWHPGFGWAWRVDTLRAMGGLIDVSVVGGADRTMALAMINRVGESGDVTVGTQAYRDHMTAWQHKAERLVRRNVGYVQGTIFHSWHGRKQQRGYETRYKILVDAGFDPRVDLRRDANGLYRLVDHGTERDVEFRDALLGYLSSRNEDSVDLE